MDNLHFISPSGLANSFNLIKKTILTIEENSIKNIYKDLLTNHSIKNKFFKEKKFNKKYRNIYKFPCEPKLSNFGLRKKVSNKLNYDFDKLVLNILLLSDGKTSVGNISKILKQNKNKILKISEILRKSKLIK